ncbi:MAG TPA: hypothetical protein VFB72_17555, partial [Verrucomicrobiae bacterium]|nr:hypothetical protein [Verrucomicrobiae bacterium]
MDDRRFGQEAPENIAVAVGEEANPVILAGEYVNACPYWYNHGVQRSKLQGCSYTAYLINVFEHLLAPIRHAGSIPVARSPLHFPPHSHNKYECTISLIFRGLREGMYYCVDKQLVRIL